MSQSGQWNADAQGRCPKHGLASVRGKACALCLELSARSKRLFAAIASASTLCLVAVVLLLGWRVDHHPFRAVQNKNTPFENPRGSVLNLKVVAARSRAVASSPRLEAESDAVDLAPTSIEDGHLGEPAAVPRVQGAPAPEPPRAPVDEEPEAPDDPRDFDLPPQAQGHEP